MLEILLPVAFVSGLGIFCGVGLVIVSYFFAVEDDPIVGNLLEILPGVNCGACGYSGCSGYANGLASGNEKNCSLCSPGGKAVAGKISAMLGLSAGSSESLCAQVLCQGDCNSAINKYDYRGVKTCAAAAMVNNGPSACDYGCFGLGDCVRACPFDSINIVDNIAVIQVKTCVGCTKCVPVCPHNLIKMFPRQKLRSAVYCRNEVKGANARKACDKACITCSRCVKTCTRQAIFIEANRAVIDVDKCNGCLDCNSVCPTKAIAPQYLPASPN